jgi:hypothetical protein
MGDRPGVLREKLNGSVTITLTHESVLQVSPGSDYYRTDYGIEIVSSTGASRRLIPWHRIAEVTVTEVTAT